MTGSFPDDGDWPREFYARPGSAGCDDNGVDPGAPRPAAP